VVAPPGIGPGLEDQARPASCLVPETELPESRVGNKRHSAATGETMGYARAPRRAFDWQPRGRSGSAAGCPGLRRCARATRFRQWFSQRSSVSIIGEEP